MNVGGPGRPAILAATAGASGGTGSFSATTLSPSGSWSVGGSTGNFQWTYPLRTPPGLGGQAPKLLLTYDSASVDGEMVATNNQPSWVGEGFDLSAGYIERGYAACSDDMGGNANNTTATGDECWISDNATLSLGGHSGELIKDSNDPNRWHLRGDDGTFVEHLTGAGNGAQNGEYWRVTTTDGTQFYFGSAPSANSTWTEPVYGNNPGEPCHQNSFAASSCTQGWRWNLDKVVDPSGNTITYQYAVQTNEYAANDNPSTPVSYDRAGYLTEIDYGTTTSSTGPAPVRVVFTTGPRCITSSCSTHDAVNWPDTPWDQQCTGAPCPNGSPTFWSTVMLNSVTTTYDDAGDVTSTTDARGLTLNYTYDQIGRKTAVYKGTVTPANQLAGWTYDGLANSRGQLTSTTSYDGGNAYTTSIRGFTATYQPTSVSYSIPAAETGLAGTYTYVYTYNADGSPSTTRIPTLDGGAMSTETLTQHYTSLGQPYSLSTSLPTATTLVPSIQYTGYGELGVVTLQTNSGATAYLADTYTVGTRTLAEQQVSRQTTPPIVEDNHYTYDPSGNPTEITDSVSGDNQCFQYDYLDRLTSAWTPANGDCAAAKSLTALGRPQRFDGYAYCADNPVSAADPTGTDSQPVDLNNWVYQGSWFSFEDVGGYRLWFELDWYALCDKSATQCLGVDDNGNPTLVGLGAPNELVFSGDWYFIGAELLAATPPPPVTCTPRSGR